VVTRSGPPTRAAVRLLQAEGDGDLHAEGIGHAVPAARAIAVLPDGLSCGLVEERVHRAKDFDIAHAAVRTDDGLEYNVTLELCRPGQWRIHRAHLTYADRLLLRSILLGRPRRAGGGLRRRGWRADWRSKSRPSAPSRGACRWPSDELTWRCPDCG